MSDQSSASTPPEPPPRWRRAFDTVRNGFFRAANGVAGTAKWVAGRGRRAWPLVRQRALAAWRMVRRPPPPRMPQWSNLPMHGRWAVAVIASFGMAVAFAVSAYLLVRTVFIALDIDWFGTVPVDQRWAEIRNGLFVVAAALGAPFVIWRTVLVAQQTAINQQTHFTDLYAKAVGMLGADKSVKQEADEGTTVERTVPNIEVRLGAIYALERIARQSDDDYSPIVETLCAYIKHNRAPPKEHGIEEVPDLERGADADVRAARLDRIEERAEALKQWARRLSRSGDPAKAAEPLRPDIHGALNVLSRLDGARRERLEGAPPFPFADDERDGLDGVEAAKRGETLRAWGWSSTWRPDLSAAQLQGVDFSRTDHRRFDFRGARLEGADLFGARLEGADLIEANLEGANLIRARLEGANLSRARLEGADLFNARLEGADLFDARLEGVKYLIFNQLASARGDVSTILPETIKGEPAAAVYARLQAEHGWL